MMRNARQYVELRNFFIPVAEQFAEDAEKANPQDLAAFDRTFHSKMNELTIAAGCGIDTTHLGQYARKGVKA